MTQVTARSYIYISLLASTIFRCHIRRHTHTHTRTYTHSRRTHIYSIPNRIQNARFRWIKKTQLKTLPLSFQKLFRIFFPGQFFVLLLLHSSSSSLYASLEWASICFHSFCLSVQQNSFRDGILIHNTMKVSALIRAELSCMPWFLLCCSCCCCWCYLCWEMECFSSLFSMTCDMLIIKFCEIILATMAFWVFCCVCVCECEYVCMHSTLTVWECMKGARTISNRANVVWSL